MPNELFGSVGFALSADRRRPKTLARRLTTKVRNRQAASYQFVFGGCQLFGPAESLGAFRGSGFLILCRRVHQSTCDFSSKLTERQGPSQKRMWHSVRD